MSSEQDLRLEMLNTLLTTPHRQLDLLWPVHQELVGKDPRFYVRLAAWYSDHGEVRDHKELFTVALALSEFPGHRDVGLALLRGLPPYQVARVVDFIHGTRKQRHVAAPNQPEVRLNAAQKKELKALRTRRKRALKLKEFKKAGRVYETKIEEKGLFRNLPRSLRTEVTRYLRERESDHEWFDSTVLTARKSLKRLYGLLHVRPGERAQKILFDEDPPPDSRLAALRELARTSNPDEQARLIVEKTIPYRVAASVMTEMTPKMLEALIERMSAQELLNNLGAMKRRGVLANPDLKTLIDLKLEEAKLGSRVSSLKAGKAIKAAGLEGGAIQAKLEDLADVQIKAKGRITRPLALLVDKSGSMDLAIDLGKNLGAMLATICESDLFVYAFDTMPYPIDRAGDKLADWERSFAGITAGGMTSCGVAIDMLRRNQQRVEQIVMITDEEENEAPFLVDALQKYRKEINEEVGVCLIRVPDSSRKLQEQCSKAGIKVETFDFKGDYYSLPNLIPLLTPPSKLDLLMEIMSYPLPERKKE